MRILILGKTGQLGSALTSALSGRGEVTALGRSELDLTDLPAVSETVRRLRPALVVNAAAYTAVDRAESESALATAVNEAAPGRIAEAVAGCGGALIHFSTDYVFDGKSDRPYDESAAAAPLSVYGRSKLAGEQAIGAAGAPHLVLRTSWLYGPTGTNFLRTMLRLGRERAELGVVDDQRGAPTAVHVVADCVAALIDRAGADPAGLFREQGGVYHLACRGETSWHGFATAIFEEARQRGLPLTVKTVRRLASHEYPTAAQRPANSRLDPSRLRESFGIETPDWRQALRVVMDRLVARERAG